jgi:hypothetical protein
MRATNLQFRSPKEYTPSAYDVRVTKEGSSLQIKRRPISAKGTFSKESRFLQFKELFKRMPAEVGPGSYCYQNGSIERSVQDKGTVLYKKLHQEKLDGSDGALLIGSLILYDERLSNRKSKRGNSASPLPSSSRYSKSRNYSQLPIFEDVTQSAMKLPYNRPEKVRRHMRQGISLAELYANSK